MQIYARRYSDYNCQTDNWILHIFTLNNITKHSANTVSRIYTTCNTAIESHDYDIHNNNENSNGKI